MEKRKVLVGMSGGVDSSVAALMLKEQGYQVTGIAMKIWDGEYKPSNVHSCYGPNEDDEIDEANSICKLLDIPFHVFDCSEQYKKLIISYFKNEYLSGRTPNPCVKCNQIIKFGLLPRLAAESGLDYDYFATGHYANVIHDKNTGRYLLLKGADLKKDQSYFLYRLDQEQLSKLSLPLGRSLKNDIKEVAKTRLNIADKKESQNFYQGSYNELLNVSESKGNIIDKKGNILGTHNGIWNYTIGQRKKIDVNTTKALFVLDVDKTKNTVTVGEREELLCKIFIVSELNWISVEKLKGEAEFKVKIRSSQQEKNATVNAFKEDSVQVTFTEPVESITPGQSAVFYSGDIVAGGGIISEILNK